MPYQIKNLPESQPITTVRKPEQSLPGWPQNIKCDTDPIGITDSPRLDALLRLFKAVVFPVMIGILLVSGLLTLLSHLPLQAGKNTLAATLVLLHLFYFAWAFDTGDFTLIFLTILLLLAQLCLGWKTAEYQGGFLLPSSLLSTVAAIAVFIPSRWRNSYRNLLLGLAVFNISILVYLVDIFSRSV